MPSDAVGPPSDCPECGHPVTAHQTAVDRRSGPCSVCGCRAIEPPSQLVLCTDPDCPNAWAYRDPPAAHYHPRPHGPEQPAVEGSTGPPRI